MSTSVLTSFVTVHVGSESAHKRTSLVLASFEVNSSHLEKCAQHVGLVLSNIQNHNILTCKWLAGLVLDHNIDGNEKDTLFLIHLLSDNSYDQRENQRMLETHYDTCMDILSRVVQFHNSHKTQHHLD